MMRTDRFTRSFQLDYGPPGSLVKRPRLWRLIIGLLCTASAAIAMAWISGWSNWAATTDTGVRLSIGALGGGGIAMALNAVARDFLHIEWARFSSDGVHLRWSYVPHLWETRVEKELQLAWREVVHLEWQEGGLEHDLKQHLVLHLKTPLCHGHERLKLLVSDDRNVSQCEALMAHLPTSVETPCWLATTRLRRRHNTT